MISLEEYKIWLAEPDHERILLVILTGYDGFDNNLFYMSSAPFYTEPTASLPNIQFESRIEEDFFIEKGITFFEKGIGTDNLSELEITNADAELDFWQNLQWDKRPITIYLGDPEWKFDDFLVKPLFIGIIDSVDFGDTHVRFRFNNRLGILNGPVQRTLLENAGENNNKTIPLAYGHLRNIEPININPNTHEYQWHDTEVDIVEHIYDKGVIVTNYVLNSAYGRFAVNNRPAGTLTLDGQTTLLKIDQVSKDLMCRLGPLNENDIDVDSFVELSNEKNYDISLYITERQNNLDILERLFASFGASLLINFEGKVAVAWIKLPENELPIVYLDSNEIALENFSIEPLNNIQWRTRLKYNRNYTIQKDGDLAGSITDPAYPNSERVEWLRNEWRIAKYEVPTLFPPEGVNFIADPDAVETVLDSISDAETECEYRQNILGTQRFLCRFFAFSVPFGLLPGDILNMNDSRYGLAEGKNMQILNIRYFPLFEKAEIEAFF